MLPFSGVQTTILVEPHPKAAPAEFVLPKIKLLLQSEHLHSIRDSLRRKEWANTPGHHLLNRAFVHLDHDRTDICFCK